MDTLKLRDLKIGEFFRFVVNGKQQKTVWVRDWYDRSSKRFLAHKFDDTNHSVEFNGDRVVTIDFEF